MARATQGLNQATLKGLQSLLSQRAAASGEPIDPNILESVFGADIKAQLQTSLQKEQLAASGERFEKQLAFQEKGLAVQEKQFATQTALTQQQLSDQASAAKVAGAVDIISAGATSYLGYELFTDKGTDVIAPKVAGVAGTTQAPSTTIGGATAGSVAGGLTAGETLAAGSIAGGEALAPATGASAGGVGGATIGTSLGGAAVGIGVSLAATELGANDEASAVLGGIAGGFVAGGPVGAVIGGVVGLVGEAIGDEVGTIICTELNRQGFMSGDLLQKSTEYRMHYIDINTYEGYLILAKPVVKLMQKSRLFMHLIKPFALGYALEVAHCLDNKRYLKGSKLGKLVMKIGIPLCRKVGHNG